MTKQTNETTHGFTRREFLKAAAAGTAGVAALSSLGACVSAAEAGAAGAGPESSRGGGAALNPQDYRYTSNSISDFSKTTLFSPWKLGPFSFNHRMVKSAAFQLAFLRNIKDEYIEYYERMAKGGVELIWIEDFANLWSFTASPMKQDIGAYDVTALLEALHNAGAKVGYQFDTMGSPVGPLDFGENFLDKYSNADIKSWIQVIIGIGKTLQDLGFDAYELNFAANNLGQSFFSRARNTRTDEYGAQNMENRCRFAREVIQGVKAACGKDFVVQVLINAIEENDRPLGDSSAYTSLAETKEIARRMEEAGADSLHLRMGPPYQHVAQFASELYFTGRGIEGSTGHGSFLDFSKHFEGKLRASHSGCGINIDVAGEIKQAVSIPVGAASYMDPAQAPDYFEAALKEGKLDFLVMNRPLCVDPQYVNKLREGRIDEIAPCTRCLHCFYDGDLNHTALLEHCRVNAANWRAYGEAMPEGNEPRPAAVVKKVMVIGGGPAGMEAARVAAQRGHQVSLYEKQPRLGGLLPTAEAYKGPHENLSRLVSYLTKQQELRGVSVKTGVEAGADTIRQENPDVVILATGAKRGGSALVSSGATKVVSFDAITSSDLGKKTVVWGSNCQAVDVALYLLDQGKEVSIVSPDPIEAFEKGHSVNVRIFIKSGLNARGVRIWPSANAAAVKNGALSFTGEGGVSIDIPCDSVVEMNDMLPDTSLLDALSGIPVIAVGDCKTPYNIAEAISSGNLAARSI
jgi:2,4-dienoyl-CoA reductase-like NADH-dependent reductase (Old Yellow Enzyme family)